MVDADCAAIFIFIFFLPSNKLIVTADPVFNTKHAFFPLGSINPTVFMVAKLAIDSTLCAPAGIYFLSLVNN
jgi:hypothetical protein